MPGYVCSKCRGGAVEVNPAKPSIDERFAIGRCQKCDAEKLLGEANRTLLRDDAQAQRELDERDVAARERRLVARWRRGDLPEGEAGKQMAAEAKAIQERWAARLHGGKEVR